MIKTGVQAPELEQQPGRRTLICLHLRLWLEVFIMFLCKIRIGLNTGAELSLEVLLIVGRRELGDR